MGVELLRWCRLQWDRVLAVVAIIGGLTALVLGWAGAASTEYVAKQVPYALSGGLGGLTLLMIGGTLWLSADLRDEWRALDRLEEQLAAHPPIEELDRCLERIEQLERASLCPASSEGAVAAAAGSAAARPAGASTRTDGDGRQSG
jgi:hypothetical protein